MKYFTDKIEKLRYIDGKSDWIDLRAAEDITLKAGEFKLIPLGVAMELPKGYEAHVVPDQVRLKILVYFRQTVWELLMKHIAVIMINGSFLH